ncbi:MAG: 1-(5-phosphoribosyl)-5-[(5-phosphoribosylamino)methylideneamino]imidazole-4-carboxamide isomerase [Anaerolineaceae bacterium]|nr:1-(5-phosphoribosyl)-5-[(5-phosphoribosylamino)methylideneamino]imidazole-4-carboxamide isomerase [Anaerolineaceae bacterium]
MTPDFAIFPAIDLRNGQVVRLKEGDPNRETMYSSNPAQAAERWLGAGTTWLHVVSLDGAFGESDSENRDALRKILKTTKNYNARIQFGGGLRDLESINMALEMGIQRAILGTVAVKAPEIILQALEKWGDERIVVSLDARDDKVQIRGWQDATDQSTLEIAQNLKSAGLRYLIYTDISRDGLQTGINLAATVKLSRETGLQVIASGGVARYEDIEAARLNKLAGIIIGRALYEGKLDANRLFSKLD